MVIFELAKFKTDKSDNCQVWIPAPLSLDKMCFSILSDKSNMLFHMGRSK